MKAFGRSGSKAVALVTGGAGFIGSNVVEQLLVLGHAVRVVDNLSTGSERNLAHLEGQIDFVRGDLRDRDTCRAAVRGIEVVFHVAALPSIPRSLSDPWACHDSNVNATMRLLLACAEAGVRRVVYSSSSSVYGNTRTLPKIESHEALPRSPYAASKLAAEQYVLAFARAGLLEAVALRYFNVFGPRQDPDSAYAAVIPAFLRAAYQGCSAVVFGDGKQTRDFTYVANVVDANLRAARAPAATASGAVINIGGGGRTSLLGLLEFIRQVTGRDVAFQFRPPRPSEVRDSMAGLARAESLIGYRPSVTLKGGLERTWDWFQAAEREKGVAADEAAGLKRLAAAAVVRPA